MKNFSNAFTKTPIAALFFFFCLMIALCLPGRIAAQVNVSQTAGFSTSNQDWYASGTSPNLTKDYLFNGAIQGFSDASSGDPAILAVSAKAGYAFDLFSDFKRMDGGRVNMNVPVSVNFSYPNDRSYGCGEEIAIQTSYTVDAGYQLNSQPPVFDMELGVKAKAGMHLGFSTAFGAEDVVNLAAPGQNFKDANSSNYESLMAGSESPFFGLNSQTGITWPWQYNNGTPPSTPPSNSLPLIIPGFVTNLAKISGTLDKPFMTNPADVIAGNAVSESSTRKFMDIAFDPIQFQEYLTGFPMRKVESIPGVFRVEYAIFSAPIIFRVYKTHRLKFEPNVEISMQLNRTYDYKVKDENGTVVLTGTGNQLTMKAGHTLLLKVPQDNQPIAFTPKYKMRNQFTTHIRDSVAVSASLEVLKLLYSTPGFTICNPFDPDDCTTIGRISDSIGPAFQKNFDITNFSFDSYAPTTYEMGGFSEVPGQTVTMYPDNAPPVTVFSNPQIALGPDGTVLVNSLTQVTSQVYDADGGGVNILNQPSLTFDCSDLGAQTYPFAITDNRCNGQARQAPLTIVDNLKPVVLVKTVELPLDANGQATLTVDQVDNGSYDNCSIVSRTLSKTSFNCADLGVNIITLTATDQSGNTQTAVPVMTVVDKMNPTVVCKNVTVNLDANGQGSITTGSVFQSGSDNCGTVNQVSVLPNTFNCSNLGANLVTLSVNDGHGNNAACTASVNVVDAIAPSVTCKNATVSLDANGQGGITTASVFQSGSDNCGTVNQVSAIPNTFSCANLGNNTVTLTVNDGHGNNSTCTAAVNVVDQIRPTFLCKNATLNLDANGTATLTTAMVNNGSFDNCGIVAMGLSQVIFTCANLGANTVLFTGADVSGNKAECTATVTVKDVIAPVAKCKNVTVQLDVNGNGSVNFSQVNNGSSDVCGIVATAVTPNAFNCAHVGANTVTLKVTDPGGNSATCTAIVTVQDNIAPQTVCKNATVYLNDVGEVSISPATVNNGSHDACGINPADLSIDHSDFYCGDLPGSPRIVKLTVKDVHNNVSSCLANVSVKDIIDPTAVCRDVTVRLDAQGKATVVSANLADNSYDNCSVWSYAPAVKTYTAANLGVNNLGITVKDWSGNADNCTSKVTVLPYNGGGQAMAVNNNGQNNHVANSTELSVFPNPAKRNVTLAFQLPQDQPVNVNLFDATGKRAFSRNFEGFEGENTLPVDLGELPAGLYMIDLQSGSVREQTRLVIQQ